MIRPAARRARRGERGFALLLVFAMAAAAMVLFYLEMPRVAFEYQRNKEQLLVERGEQFTRAITLYHRKFQKLPQNLDELENTNNLRFLRKKYVDPITGKDEWRLVHVDAAGQYVDSLVHKRQGQGEQKGPSVLAATIQGIGSQAEYIEGAGGDQNKNPALQRRASDRISPGTPGGGGVPDGEHEADAGTEEQSRSGLPSEAGASGDNPIPPAPGTDLLQGAGQTLGPNAQPVPTGVAGQPAVNQPATTGQPQPLAPGSLQPGQQPSGQPVQAPGSNPGATGGGFGFSGGFGTASPQPQAPGIAQPGAVTGGSQGGGMPGAIQAGPQLMRPSTGSAPPGALDQIRNMRGGQRPATGVGGSAAGAAQPGTMGTGGVVGVASKAEMPAILVYNEKTNIKEWEFLFDMKKAAQAAGAQGQGGQQNPAQPNQPNQPNQPGRQGGPGVLAPGGTQTPRPGASGFGFGGSPRQ